MESDCRTREEATVPHVLVVGDARHREFTGPLRQVESSAHARLLCDWQAARDSLGNAASLPDLVILLRNRPDGIQVSNAIELAKLAPDTCFVWLLGSWCEGEAHTGQTWEGLEKIYWHTFRHWWERYCRETSGRDNLANANGNQLAVVHTGSVLTFEAIADSLAMENCSAVWQHPQRRAPLISGATAGIWEGGQLLPHEQESLHQFCQSLGSYVPVVALLDFPQFDQVQLARELGASQVLGKPWREDDLINSCIFRGNAVIDEPLAKSRAA